MDIQEFAQYLDEWAQKAVSDIEQIHEECHARDVDCSHASVIEYGAVQMMAISHSLQDCIHRFVLTAKLIELNADKLSKSLGKNVHEIIDPLFKQLIVEEDDDQCSEHFAPVDISETIN